MCVAGDSSNSVEVQELKNQVANLRKSDPLGYHLLGHHKGKKNHEKIMTMSHKIMIMSHKIMITHTHKIMTTHTHKIMTMSHTHKIITLTSKKI